MQGRAGARLGVAQGRQIGGGHRLRRGGLGLQAGALGDVAGQRRKGALGLEESRVGRSPGDELGQRLIAADFGAEALVAQALARLTAQRFNLGIDLAHHVFDAGEVLFRRFQPQFGLVPARVQAGDPGRLLQHQPPRRRLGGNDLADLPLPHHRRRAGAGRGVGEQQLHVARAGFAAVDLVGRALVALDAADDLDGFGIVEGGRGAAVGIVQHQPDFRDIARGAAAGTGEDDVLHAGGAHVLVGVLAHDPAHGLDEIGLAAAVRTDDAGEARLDLEFHGVAETLEPGQFQPLELHLAPEAARIALSTVHKKSVIARALSTFPVGKPVISSPQRKTCAAPKSSTSSPATPRARSATSSSAASRRLRARRCGSSRASSPATKPCAISCSTSPEAAFSGTST